MLAGFGNLNFRNMSRLLLVSVDEQETKIQFFYYFPFIGLYNIDRIVRAL